MVDGQSTRTTDPAPPHRRVPLIFVLGAAFTLVAVVSSIAYLSLLHGATVTTEKLLHDRTHRLVEDEVRLVKNLFDPVLAQLGLFAILTDARHAARTSTQDLAEGLTLPVLRIPGVAVVEFHGTDGHVHRAIRAADGSVTHDQMEAEDTFWYLLEGRLWQTGSRVFWSPVIWSTEIRQPVIKVGVPVEGADGELAGGFVLTVAISELSRQLSEASDDSTGVGFILVDRDKVLAHPRLIDQEGLNLSAQKPLPEIDQVNDAVLAAIRNKPVDAGWLAPDLHALGHVVEVRGARWLYVHRQLQGFGPMPWLVGRYFSIEEVTGTVSTLANSTFVGAATLGFAFLLAAYVSLKLSYLIGTITSGARAIGRLEFDQVHYKPSRVQEIDDAGHSLDRARDALRWFGAYVPKSLVRRLMDSGETGLVSGDHVVTVMFTDIVQFSLKTRNWPVDDVADLLNRHFAILGGCIERQGGIIDKFIGDAVMAVWGGPSGPGDHADAAVQAALEIIRALDADNRALRSAGKEPIQVRIGIHTGPVVAGNIGLAGRVNYTVVGDTVNVAQHLERFGKEVAVTDEDVVCLASRQTVAALDDRSLVKLFEGQPVLRFRMDSVGVECFRLLPHLAHEAAAR